MPSITQYRALFTRARALLAILAISELFRPALLSAQPIIPEPNSTGTEVNKSNNTYDITGGVQSSGNLFHSFQEFGLNNGETANFLSSPEINNILSRVTGGRASIINGLIQVTGGNSNLFLINPAGIVFGPNASLNVTADFFATTANGIGFGNGNWFNSVGNVDWTQLVGTPSEFVFDWSQPGNIANLGNLTLNPGQNLTLLGGTVLNTGNLATAGGNITIAAVPGENLVRISQTGHLLSLEIATTEIATDINNPGFPTPKPLDIPAFLTGGEVLNATNLVKHPDGRIDLTSAAIANPGNQTNQANQIIPIPNQPGTNITSGTIDVSGNQQPGNTTGGTVNILGENVGLFDANINANGLHGGGTVFVGGGFQGNGSIPNAQQTIINPNSVINVDALISGDGGRAIAWGNNLTRFYGNISARGGTEGGDGGLVEVSGKQLLVFSGIVDASSPQGNPGTLLLDPKNITIQNPDSPLATLLNPDATENDHFGISVAGVGNNVAVGAYKDDPGGVENAGTAYLFAPNGDLLQTFNNPEPNENDNFGWSVAGVQNNVAVGAPNDDPGGVEDAGSAYLFDGNTGDLLQTFNNPDPTIKDGFGTAVAGVVNNVAVGAPKDDPGGIEDAGSVYLFDGNTGGLLHTLNSPDPIAKEDFGQSVAGVGNNVAVGAPLYSPGGVTEIGRAFLFNGNTGVLLHTFDNPEQNQNDQFGKSVAGVGNNVAVGSPENDLDGVEDAGTVYLFDGNTGGLLQTINNPEPEPDGRFGISVAGDGNYLAVGALKNLSDGVNAGAAYVFNGESGQLLQTHLNPAPISDDQFGKTVAIANSRLAVGTRGADVSGIENQGTAYLFGMPIINPFAFDDYASDNITISPSSITGITNTGTNVTMQANTDIIVNEKIITNYSGNETSETGGNITFQAGRSIKINADITTDNGDLTLVGNETVANGVVDAHRDPGIAEIAIAPDVTLDTGTGNLNITLSLGEGLTYNTSGDITLGHIKANSLILENNGPNQGSTIVEGELNLAQFNATETGESVDINHSIFNQNAIEINAPNINLNGSIQTTGDPITLNGTVTLTGNSTINTGNGVADITFQGTVDGSQQLTLDAHEGQINFLATVGLETPLEALVINSAGQVNVAGGLRTQSSLTLAMPVSLTEDSIFSSETGILTFDSSLTAGEFDVTLQANQINWTNEISGNGTLTLQPETPNLGINIGSDISSGNLDIHSEELANLQDGFSQITIGRSDGTGQITVENIQVSDPVLIQSPQGNIALQGDVVGTDNAAIALEASQVNLGANISTTGNPLSINSNVALDANVTLQTDGGNLEINGQIDGDKNFTVNAGTGTVNFRGNIGNSTPLNSLIVTGKTAITDLELVKTNHGEITFNAPLTLTGENTELSAGNGSITFNSSLIVSSTLAGVTLAGGQVTVNNITTDGGAVKISAQADLTTGNIITGSGDNRAADINLNSYGTVTTGNLDASAQINSGEVTVTSTNSNIKTEDINTSAVEGPGGAIALNSPAGIVETGDLTATGTTGGTVTVITQTSITTGNIDTSGTSGNGADVLLDPEENISVGFINAQGGPDGSGGNVDITTGQYFTAGETFLDQNGAIASISTSGGTGGGNITIRHDGGNRSQDFVVGDASNNGTAGVITTGADNTIEIGRSFPGPVTEGKIQIVTAAPPADPAPKPEPLPDNDPGDPAEPPPKPEPRADNNSPAVPAPTEKTPPVEPQLDPEIEEPTPEPTGEDVPTPEPTAISTWEPTGIPTSILTSEPTAIPTSEATPISTSEPTLIPTSEPTSIPTSEATPISTSEPTGISTSEPTGISTSEPTGIPTSEPTGISTSEPTGIPTSEPTGIPTSEPTGIPTSEPTGIPTSEPTGIPTSEPTQIVGSQAIATDLETTSESESESEEETIENLVSPETVAIIDPGVADIENSFTQTFTNYNREKREITNVSLPEAQNIIRSIELSTGIKPVLLYVRFAPTSMSGISENDPLELILVTGDGSPIRKVLSATRAEVLETADNLITYITSPIYRQLTTYLKPAQQLYQWLIAPIKAELDSLGIENIAFIMDQGLRGLPVAALHDGSKFLVETYSLGMMPSLSLTDTRYRNIQNASVLAMGASEFEQLNALPAVPTELETITEEIRGGSSFLNEAFTLKNIQSEYADLQYPIVHMATHGEFESGDISDSYIQLWDQKLRLNDIRQLGFHNPTVELLVLSACRTAVGSPEAELGFAGLALQAGVKTAIASLWYVSDAGTFGLMTEFYKHLSTAPIKAEAMRQAQVSMINGNVQIQGGQMRGSRGSYALPESLQEIQNQTLTHPYYWAAFTLIGSPW